MLTSSHSLPGHARAYQRCLTDGGSLKSNPALGSKTLSSWTSLLGQRTRRCTLREQKHKGKPCRVHYAPILCVYCSSTQKSIAVLNAVSGEETNRGRCTLRQKPRQCLSDAVRPLPAFKQERLGTRRNATNISHARSSVFLPAPLFE